MVAGHGGDNPLNYLEVVNAEYSGTNQEIYESIGSEDAAITQLTKFVDANVWKTIELDPDIVKSFIETDEYGSVYLVLAIKLSPTEEAELVENVQHSLVATFPGASTNRELDIYYTYNTYLNEAYLDEIRISKVARFTDDFNPPTVPYGSAKSKSYSAII
jgi:hypothetical protein